MASLVYPSADKNQEFEISGTRYSLDCPYLSQAMLPFDILSVSIERSV